ncbi:SAND domain-containing protein, partial [Haematococcus lacustris]
MTPTEFERHSGMQASKKWRRSIKVDMGRNGGTMSLGRWLDANGYKQEQPAVRGSGSPFVAPPNSQPLPLPLPRMQARPGMPNMGGSMRGPPGIATGRGPHLMPLSAPYAAIGLDGLYEEPSVAYALSGQGPQPAAAGMWPQGSGALAP